MDTTITWGPSIKHDSADSGGIAVNADGVAVEVHTSGQDLWYRVGKVDYAAKTIAWGDSQKYDDGISANPSVAIAGNTVVEVHDRPGAYTVWYRVGVVDPLAKKIAWGDSHQYDDGITPGVALTSAGVAVEVHSAYNNIEDVASLGMASQHALWYRVGTVDTTKKTISWGDSHKFDDGPSLGPNVAINDNGLVVEVHQSAEFYRIWCHVGTLDAASKKIAWGDSKQYDDGVAPSVAISIDGTAVEVHRCPDDTVSAMKLWYRVGSVDGAAKKVTWNDSHKYDDGIYPWVAMSGACLVELHQSENEDRLWYHVGEL